MRSILGDRPSTVVMTLTNMTDERLASLLRRVAGDVRSVSPEDRRQLLLLAARRLEGDK